jgi:tetratricopeptide (TPR) repeat protein
MLDNPMLALMYYNAALNIAKAPDERQVAYFGIAKMQFWLGHYVRAETTYRDLLTEHLNRKDYELALAGLIKSLAYQDKTRLAYSYVPEDMVFTTPEMVIAASQASLWSDWGDITRDILTEYQPITQKLDPWSPLGGDFRDLQWQTALATSPNTLTPTFFYSGDSDGFIKRHSTLNYRRYWSQIFQTSVGVDHFL